MDALGKLTSGIAHDYNNLLGVILGYSEMLSLTLKDSQREEKYINEIIHAVDRGTKLTKKLLAFSKKKSSENKVVSLNDVLNDSRLMLEKTLTSRIELEFDMQDTLWQVNIDEGELEDAILNISINSMHAIKDNGQIIYKTRNEHVSDEDATRLEIEPGDYVLLSITDTGKGMVADVMEKVFDPFFTTKGEGGTGLGLSQVYGFVRRSNGAISLYSEIGHGTRLVMYFPRHSVAVNAKESVVPETASNLSGNETILVVDDERSLLDFTAEVLTQNGYNVLTANSAYEALGILSSTSVDILLSDVIMPEMDGFQLASEVKQRYPNIKIQLASGFSDNVNSDLVDDELKDNILEKPYHSEALLKRLRVLLNN
jgi:CheY-like chemotaxis protein